MTSAWLLVAEAGRMVATGVFFSPWKRPKKQLSCSSAKALLLIRLLVFCLVMLYPLLCPAEVRAAGIVFNLLPIGCFSVSDVLTQVHADHTVRLCVTRAESSEAGIQQEFNILWHP